MCACQSLAHATTRVSILRDRAAAFFATGRGTRIMLAPFSMRVPPFPFFPSWGRPPHKGAPLSKSILDRSKFFHYSIFFSSARVDRAGRTRREILREGDDTFRRRRGTVLDDIRKLNEIGDFLIQPMLVRNWNNRWIGSSVLNQVSPASPFLPRSPAIDLDYPFVSCIEGSFLGTCTSSALRTGRRRDAKKGEREREAKVWKWFSGRKRRFTHDLIPR